MVHFRRIMSQSDSGNYEPTIDPQVHRAFDEFDCMNFPEMRTDPPPEKSLKERILEQHKERVRAIKAHEKRFSVEPYIPDPIFMRRRVEDFDYYDTSAVTKSSLFKQDLESFDTISEPDPHLSEICLQRSNFLDLHEPRGLVSWSKSKRDIFIQNIQEMNDRMGELNIKRLPNREKRLKKLNSVNLNLKRYNAEEVRSRIENGTLDLFGYLSLLTHTFTKSKEPSVDLFQNYFTRKRTVFERCVDMFEDFDYSKRPGAKEISKYVELVKRKEELEVLVNNLELEDIPSCSSDVFVPASSNEVLKRKASVIIDEEFEIPPKRMEKEKHFIAESSNEKSIKPIEKIDHVMEEARKERERRRIATQKREQEALEKQKRDAEEHQRRHAAEIEEYERRQEERKRMEAEEERKKIEENRIAMEKRRIMIDKEERRRKLEESERQLRIEQEEALELERMRLELAQKARDVIAAETPQPPKPIEYAKTYVPFKCKMPRDWSRRKDKFLNKFGWPTDKAHCQLERSEAVSRALAMSSDKLIIIPQENNPKTLVIPLSRPIRKAQPVVAPIFKIPRRVGKELVPADKKALEQIVKEIKILMRVRMRGVTPVFMSLFTKEIDYMAIGIDRLKMNMVYPFRQSDGMYWPVFYALRNTSIPGHVKALATCKSFSGKCASYQLLTTSKEDDTRRKKFQASYMDCAGDWAEYSRKPGRFSNRIGYKAHYNSCKDGFDIQRNRARERQKDRYRRQREEDDDFGVSMARYNQEGTQYKQKLKIHLRELVKDARIDAYSLKQEFREYDDRVMTHPGTRLNLLDTWWHSHGYRLFLERRDYEYAVFMEYLCADYERLLPRIDQPVDRLNDWCFSPMLASLYYQVKYNPFDLFSKDTMKSLRQRQKKYHALTMDRKFNYKEAYDVCRLTDLDKKQWTILHDQLVSHFRDFPAIFQIMYDQKGRMIPKADRVVDDLMKTVFADCANSWDYLKKI